VSALTAGTPQIECERFHATLHAPDIPAAIDF
jgi:hypothetical protein